MANNRLYIVDKENNEHLMLAKHYSDGWLFGNVDLLDSFLGQIYDDNITSLILGTENDREFYAKHLSGKNYNESGKWTYYQPNSPMIAAAPEMYEVLKGLEALGSDIAPYWAERIKSAIAKAEGINKC